MMKWRLQFGTRTLLVLIVLVAVGLGGWRYWVATYEQRALATAIRDLPTLTDEEKNALCAIVWGQSGMGAESNEWLYGTWKLIAYSDNGEFHEETRGVRWRYESDKVIMGRSDGKEFGCVYSRAGQHRVMDVSYRRRVFDTNVYNGDGDVLLIRHVRADEQPKRRDSLLPQSGEKYELCIWCRVE